MLFVLGTVIAAILANTKNSVLRCRCGMVLVLTHRLAQRTSAFLRILGTEADAQETYRNVSKGYKIRSTFIHGGSLKTKDRPQADALKSVLLEHTRKCILAFCQLSKAKDEILAELDNTMIVPSSIPDLENSLRPVIYK